MADQSDEVDPRLRMVGESVAEWHERLQRETREGVYDPPSVEMTVTGTGGSSTFYSYSNKISGKAGQILDHLLPGEPIVIFRAKDVLSTMVLHHYIDLLEIYSPHTEIMDDMIQAMNQVRDWQRDNPDKVKLPD